MAERDGPKWDERYSGSPLVAAIEGTAFLEKFLEYLPPSGRLLEVAGGLGADALFFAKCGFDVTLADVSEVALELARRGAELHGVALKLLALDLEQGFPSGPWDGIHCQHYLDRSLFERCAQHLRVGGVLGYSHPTVVNLERNLHPSKRYLYEVGEMRQLATAAGLVVLHHHEGWGATGKHEAQLMACLPTNPHLAGGFRAQ